MTIGKIEQLTETPVKGTEKMVLPLLNKEGTEVDVSPLHNFMHNMGSGLDTSVNKVPPPEVLRHEWSYAVVPGQSNFNIYLTGFCKKCQTAFTTELNTTHYSMSWKPLDGVGDPCITKLDIPLYGCEYKKY
jgi:hypothetical protein